MLGYGIDPASDVLIDALDRGRALMAAHVDACSTALDEAGTPLTLDDLAQVPGPLRQWRGAGPGDGPAGHHAQGEERRVAAAAGQPGATRLHGR